MEIAEIPTRGVRGRGLPLFRKRHIIVDPSTARIVSTQLSFVAAPSRLGSGQPVAQAAASHALDIRALRFTGFRTDLEPRTYMHLPSMGDMDQLILSPQELLHASSVLLVSTIMHCNNLSAKIAMQEHTPSL